MAKFEASVVSVRSPHETFDYLAEFSHAAEWDPGTATARRLDDGPLGLGSRFALEVTVGPRRMPLEYRIAAYEPPRRVVLVAESDSVRSQDTITVMPASDGGALVTYQAVLTLQGRLAVANGLLGPFFDRIGAAGAAGLRRVLSGPPAEPADGRTATSAWPGPLSWVADEALEASLVGSFSALGPRLRAKAAGWERPPGMEGKVALVTGATSGLGLATATGLAGLGATVVLSGRGHDRAAQAVDTVKAAVPDADVSFLLADMGEFDEVRSLAEEFVARHDRLDVLVHNAGALTKDRITTASGIEVTVASQVAAPFLLTGLMLPVLEAAVPSRVIQVSSGGMYSQRFDLDALEMGSEEYDGTVAYARAKRAQLILLHEWTRRTTGSGVTFQAMHPGWADTPGIRHSLPGFSRALGPALRTAEEGADTAVWLAAAPEGVERPGRFWLDRRPRWEHKVPWTRLSPEAELAAGAALWEWCVQCTGWDLPTEASDRSA